MFITILDLVLSNNEILTEILTFNMFHMLFNTSKSVSNVFFETNPFIKISFNRNSFYPKTFFEFKIMNTIKINFLKLEDCIPSSQKYFDKVEELIGRHCNTLIHLDLSCNSIVTKNLTKVLLQCTTLKHLDLKFNRIKSDDVSDLASFIKG